MKKHRVFKTLVLEKGLEPLNLSAPDPKSGVFANFTTQASYLIEYQFLPFDKLFLR